MKRERRERRKKQGEKKMREEERKKTYKKKQREKHRDREKQTQRKKQKGREDDLNSRFKNACLMMEKNYAKNSRHHVIAIFVDPHVSTNQSAM